MMVVENATILYTQFGLVACRDRTGPGITVFAMLWPTTVAHGRMFPREVDCMQEAGALEGGQA